MQETARAWFPRIVINDLKPCRQTCLFEVEGAEKVLYLSDKEVGRGFRQDCLRRIPEIVSFLHSSTDASYAPRTTLISEFVIKLRSSKPTCSLSSAPVRNQYCGCESDGLKARARYEEA